MRDPTPPDVALHPEVYEPAEDSWLLLRALAREPRLAGARALDVGTGTGMAALWMLREGAARVVATDLNPHAARLAQENGRRLDLHARLDVVRGDLDTALRPHARFDLVTFNAPYLPSEPHERLASALDHAFHGGEGGVETAARLVRALPERLAPQGSAYLVVSDRGDLPALAEAARRAGLVVEEAGREAFFFERVLVWRLHRGDAPTREG